MNEKVAKKWVKALRSGKYKQTRHGKLRIGDAFCCLGVLCDLYIKEKPQEEWYDMVNIAPGVYSFLGAQHFLPDPVVEWADATSAGHDWSCKLIRLLPNMNDQGSTFSEIADYIEKHTKEL